MKLQPITIEVAAKDRAGTTNKFELHCKHEDVWPPAHARLDASPIDLRQSGVIDEAKFQQLQTWERICGLLAMTEAKCSTCPLALVHHDGHWVPFTPGGKPTTGLPPFAKARPGRRNKR